MSWDRHCKDCGGQLVDRSGKRRVCTACNRVYHFDGKTLRPVGGSARSAPEEIPFEEAVARYSEVFPDRGEEGALATVGWLRERGFPLRAAEALSGMVIRAREVDLMYPGDEGSVGDLEGQLEVLLDELSPRAAQALRKRLATRRQREERARTRMEVDPERLAPFRAELGMAMGRFLGNREPIPDQLPEEVSPPRDPVGYRLVPPEEDEGPALDPFHVRPRLVTNEAYASFLEATRYPPHPLWGWRGLDRKRSPVVGVSWEAAAAFAAWVGGRLPTEEEWKAARKARALLFHRRVAWEVLLDDAGAKGVSPGPQGVVLAGAGHPTRLRSPHGTRSRLRSGSGRADTGFRVVLDPRMA